MGTNERLSSPPNHPRWAAYWWPGGRTTGFSRWALPGTLVLIFSKYASKKSAKKGEFYL